MPNWVFHTVEFYGKDERIKELKEFVTSDKNEFDFNKIIPMPDELNLDHGTIEMLAIKCAKAYSKGMSTIRDYEKEKDYINMTFMECVKLGKKYLSNKKKYGVTTWYDWCIHNWGTKWNSYEAIWYGDNYVEFKTAWSEPEPIFRKLSQLFPDVEFIAYFANEDLGNDCGTIEYLNGYFHLTDINTYEFACDVWKYDYAEGD